MIRSGHLSSGVNLILAGHGQGSALEGFEIAVGGVNYASPVRVNGYAYNNCSEVDLAAKNIDPAHPHSGPLDRDAATDPTRVDADPVKVAAARKKAEAIQAQIVGYSPMGVRNGAVAPGAAFSLVG